MPAATAPPGMFTLKPTDGAADEVFLSGWKSPEHDFVWALGPVNIMNIPLGPASEYRGRNLKFAIEVNVPLTASNPEGSRLTFMLGGTVLLDAHLPAGTHEVVLVCQSGMRSRVAQAILSGDPARTYLNLAGGMAAWQSHGLPIVRHD